MTGAVLIERAQKRLMRKEQMQLARDLRADANGPSEDPADVEEAWASETIRRPLGRRRR